MTITRTFYSRFCGLFLVIFCGCSALSLKAQNIPDANFAAAIRAICPECIDASNNLTYAVGFISNLDVSNKNISNLTGIRGFSSLNTLNCSNNNLATLPVLPYWLTSLTCRNNLISSLPTTLPLYLQQLNCINNPLTCLPCLPASMINLTVAAGITCLPNIVNGLTVYNASGSIITLPTCGQTTISVPIDLCVGSSSTITARLTSGSAASARWQLKSPTDVDYVDIPLGAGQTFSGTIATLQTSVLSNASNGTRYRAVFMGTCPVVTEPAVIRMSSGFRIPDLYFLNAVRRDCPSCIDACGNISSLAAERVRLNLDNLATFQYITDLSGLEYFTGLKTLIISNNNININRFPPLPSTLTTLQCVKSGLTALPTLPNTLEVLICTGNKLTELPALPSTLNYLDCYDNKLTTLPTLPNGLSVLYCATNPLSNLPNLPNSLRTLYCYKNNLTALPTLPNSLVYLNCGNNNLSQLPTLSTNLVSLVCSTNPNLTCLPILPTTLRELYITETNIGCLPNTNAVLRTYNPANNAIPMPPMCTTPSITLPPSVSINANLGETATLTAVATGSDEMTVKWRKKPVNAPQFEEIANSAAPYQPNTNAHYTTSPLTVTDNGTQYAAVFSTACFGSAAAQPITVNVSTLPLPVELKSFTGTAQEGMNKLAWETAMQSKLSHFDVERSENGNDNWTKLGKIAAQKDSKAALFYAFDDAQPLSVSYYRLVAVDLDGTFKHTKTLSLTQKTAKLSIEKLYPNPVGNNLQVRFNAPQSSNLTMTVADVLGKVVITKIVTANQGGNIELIDMSIVPNGIYFFSLNDGKTHQMQRLVKQ
jgi:Leucine-rich repeat (LRR) protein